MSGIVSSYALIMEIHGVS